MSIENRALTEVITIYEKLKKGRENRVYRHSKFIDLSARVDIEFHEAEETVPIVPSFLSHEVQSISVLDFNTFNLNFHPTKYLYFSEKSHLLQADFLEGLAPNYTELLQAKNYWLNIFDPNEADFAILFNSFGVHDLTINDIR
jgi:hypothetical protein